MTSGANVKVARGNLCSISTEPPRPGSAAELHLRVISDGLARVGWRVNTLWAPLGDGRRWLDLMLFQFRSLRRLKGNDLLYFRWHVLDTLFLLAAKSLQIPYVLEVNGPPDDLIFSHPKFRRLGPILRALAKWQIRGAAQVIVVGAGLKSLVDKMRAGLPPSKLVVNGADAELSSHLSHAAEPPYAVYFGDFSRWQGIDTILSAWESTHWPAGLGLVMIGDGAMADEVRQMSMRSELQYLGRLSRVETYGWLAKATVSISAQSEALPRNQFAGLPFKVTESLMMGVPVVASHTPGQASIVRESPGGAVYSNDSVAELCRGLGSTIGRDLADRCKTSRFAQERLSWTRATSETSQILAAVLGGAT